MSKRKPKTVSIHAKCSDMCFTEISDADGNQLAENDGYVPPFMPGQHYGDYVILEIDVESGRILNWKSTAAAEVQEYVDTGKDED